jgi:hypothetical protein
MEYKFFGKQIIVCFLLNITLWLFIFSGMQRKQYRLNEKEQWIMESGRVSPISQEKS